MANIAEGWLSIVPVSKGLAACLSARIQESGRVFNYSGEADILWADDEFEATFTARWTCCSAWDLLDDLLADARFEFRDELVAALIKGRGREPALGHKELVRKLPGERKLRRKSTGR